LIDNVFDGRSHISVIVFVVLVQNAWLI
jgi:hypothetical protein